MRRILLLAVLLAISSCQDADTDGPEPVKFDRDTCQRCGMIISDRLFAAEVRGGPRQKVSKFDDVGCAVAWLAAQPFAADPATRLWVSRASNGTWVNARAAHYVGGRTSPMGYGFGAVDPTEPGVGFESMRQQVVSAASRQAIKGEP